MEDSSAYLAAAAVVILLVLVYCWYRFLYGPFQLLNRVGIRHPPVTPFFGHFTQALKLGILEALDRDILTYGKVFGWYIGARPWIVVADADMLKEIFVKKFNHFSERNIEPLVMSYSRGSVPCGLFFMGAEQWRAIRPIVSPTFTAKKLKLMSPLIEKSCVSLKDRLGELSRTKEKIDLWRVYGQFTMETFIATTYGFKLNIVNGGEGNALTRAAAGVLAEIEGSTLLWSNLLLSHFSTELKLLVALLSKCMTLQVAKDTAYLAEFTAEVIDKRRHSSEPVQSKDLLQLLIDARADDDDVTSSKKTLTDQEIVGLSNDFLLAGYETTSNTLAFVSYLLAFNPDKQDILCEAIDEYYRENEDASIYDGAHDIQYVDWVAHESLRVYPPVPRTSRYCTETCVINGVTFPKSCTIAIPIRYLHYSTEHWYKPDEFRPERFSEEEKEGRHPLCYIPFGWGLRNCIGMRFALLEVKMALVAIFKHYKFERGPDTQVPMKMKQGLSQRPADGVYLTIIKRH